MKNTRTLALFLALFTALPLASCGSEGTSETTTDGNTTPAAETDAPGYAYPDVNYDNYEFRVLNFDKYANCNVRVDVTEQSGEKLDDAIYLRNRKVEEKLGFKMKEIQFPYGAWGTCQKEIIALVTNSVMAGDDQYDAAYLNLNFNIGAIADGVLVDLASIETLNLESDWWDHDLNDSLTVNGRMYGASSPLMLETFDLAWCMFFNEKMMDDLKLEYPYQLVRDGKWTLDKLYEYVSSAASLNGAESFTSYDVSGKSVYGIAGHLSAPEGMIYSAGCDYVKKVDGEYKLTIESDRFYTTIDRLKKVFNADAGYVRFNNGGKAVPEGYLGMFSSGRALFLTGELKSAMEERDMNDQFGILPMPKFDESQENYRTLVNGGSALLCVPATNKDLDRTGVILDALSYESSESVLPVYYDVTVSQKGLRNEDSIEMLQILKSTRGCEIASFYSLGSTLRNGVQSILCSGGTESPASLIAANKSAVAEDIVKTLDAIK